MMNITAIPAFSDNYIWLIEKEGDAVLVDPGEAEGAIEKLQERNLNLIAILLTHEHDDHVGGVHAVRTAYPTATVYGPSETDDLNDVTLREGDEFKVLGKNVAVLKTAGHTKEHISYQMNEHVFCGDALFSAGCGRVFTGDYTAQFNALQKFKALDDNSLFYAGHEYTESNLAFLVHEFPEDDDIAEIYARVQALRAQGEMTLPTDLKTEKMINKMMMASNVEEFKALRLAKDNF